MHYKETSKWQTCTSIRTYVRTYAYNCKSLLSNKSLRKKEKLQTTCMWWVEIEELAAATTKIMFGRRGVSLEHDKEGDVVLEGYFWIEIISLMQCLVTITSIIMSVFIGQIISWSLARTRIISLPIQRFECSLTCHFYNLIIVSVWLCQFDRGLEMNVHRFSRHYHH